MKLPQFFVTNDLGFTGGPLAWFQTPFLVTDNFEANDYFQVPRPWNVTYTKSGTTRTITFEDNPDMLGQTYWKERLKGYYMLRGRSGFESYARTGKLEVGKKARLL